MPALDQTWPALRHSWMTALNQPEILAFRALGFVRSRPDGMARLTSHSGISEGDLGRRPPSAEQLAAVLDFLVTNEALLREFIGQTALPVEAAYEARLHFVRRQSEPAR